jgi:hypothetical protein
MSLSAKMSLFITLDFDMNPFKNMNNPNPFGKKKVDLSHTILSCEQKEWLALDVISKHHKAAYWDGYYNLPIGSTSRWARKL